MTRLLIYLFPALIDMMVGTVFFVGAVRLAESGASASAVTAVIAVWAVVYMITSLALGRCVNRRNAAWLVMASGLLMVAVAVAFILFDYPFAIYILMAVQAVASAFFFTPFQIFMKAVETGRTHGLVRSTALYTFSWSLGMASGPFISGYVWSMWGWQWCYAISALMAFLTTVGIFWLRHHAHGAPPINYAKTSGYESHNPAVTCPNTTDPATKTFNADSLSPSGNPGQTNPADTAVKDVNTCTVINYEKLPDFAWLGWIAAGCGGLAFYLILAIFPLTAVALQISKPQQGIILALISASRALTGLCFLTSRVWMYRSLPIGLFGLTGLLGMLLFASGHQAGVFYAAAICFGVYTGSYYFYLVFHSLSHPTRSARYVSINEAVVGISAFVGPQVGGLLADHYTLATPYYWALALVAGSLLVQVVVHRRHDRQVLLISNNTSK